MPGTVDCMELPPLKVELSGVDAEVVVVTLAML